jgi:hypothetical protein
MKRLFIASALGLIAFSSVFALAATLGGISPASLGADDAAVTSCDSDGVSAGYSTSYDEGVPGFVVSDVIVSGIDDDCIGKTIDVVLTEDGANVGEGDAVVAAGDPDDNETTVAIAAEPAAESVNDIHIAIHD